MGQNVLILSYSNLDRDPRLHKQITAFKDRYSLVTGGLSPSSYDDLPFIDLMAKDRDENAPRANLPKHSGSQMWAAWARWRQRHESRYWDATRIRALHSLAAQKFDLVWSNDIDTLPLALKISEASGARVHFDAHEYFPGQYEHPRSVDAKFVTHLCRRYVHRVDTMSTVSPGLARLFRKFFRGEIHVLENVPMYCELEPSQVSEERIRLVHHGGAIRGRRLELLIEMMDFLDERFELGLMLVKNHREYYDELEELVAKRKNVHMRVPVEMTEIARTINEYDLGVYILPEKLVNNKFALPNKLFEFVQARLGIAIGPTFQMSELVRAKGLGIVAGDFSPRSLANEISQLTAEQVTGFKNNAHAIAKRYSFDTQREQLCEIADNLLR